MQNKYTRKRKLKNCTLDLLHMLFRKKQKSMFRLRKSKNKKLYETNKKYYYFYMSCSSEEEKLKKTSEEGKLKRSYTATPYITSVYSMMLL